MLCLKCDGRGFDRIKDEAGRYQGRENCIRCHGTGQEPDRAMRIALIFAAILLAFFVWQFSR